MRKKISTFKLRIESINDQHVKFRLYSGYGLNETHALCQSLDTVIVLDTRQFVDFALRLVAFVYIDREPTNDEIKIINKKMNMVIFDNYDPQKAKPLITIKNYVEKGQKNSV